MSRQSTLVLQQSLALDGVFMSRQSTITLRHKVPRHGVSMSRHSVLCHDSGAQCCNKAGCAHAVKLCRARQALAAHDNVASCCVTTEEALRIRQTRPDGHDKPGHAHDKGLGA